MANSRQPSDSSTGLYAQVQRLARPGAADEAQYGAGGLSFAAPPAALVALFELTEPLQFPGEGDDEPDVPYSENARLVWLLPADTYGGVDHARPQTLYHPTVLRSAGAAVGVAPLCVGQRCYAWFNRQSGRWEALAMPLLWRRFEMTAALTCGTSATALAFAYDAAGQKITAGPPAETIAVHDALACFSKMPTANGDPGALGLALFWPDRGRWEIAAMQTPGDFWGTLAGDLHAWDIGQQVRVGSGGVLGGYSVFGAQHGPLIDALNPAGGGNEAAHCHSGRSGDRVFCRWDIRAGHYWIMAVEPNDFDWPTLDVVTRTTVTIDFDAKTFTHRYYTRQIQLPPWTSVSAEVMH